MEDFKMTVIVSIEDAQKIAFDEWNKPENRGKFGCKKCAICLKKWRGQGSKPDFKPPIFPESHSGACPVCKGALS
jgi:hypothetical protein